MGVSVVTVVAFLLSMKPFQVWDDDRLCHEAVEPDNKWLYSAPVSIDRILSRSAPWRVSNQFIPEHGYKLVGRPEFIDTSCERAWDPDTNTLFTNVKNPIFTTDWCAIVRNGETLDGGKFKYCRGILALPGSSVRNVQVENTIVGIVSWRTSIDLPVEIENFRIRNRRKRESFRGVAP